MALRPNLFVTVYTNTLYIISSGRSREGEGGGGDPRRMLADDVTVPGAAAECLF